mmetsp:Transcript_12588/g.12396  ORF Transcript_12588/g.12396 Transcript_12588/m.12396 type:complete len:95 (+) Transcript_12588:262-546(+)|eukprot:CAMPEP_0170547478 /NCGR_PEP_ID=MMETSP0211-20121228/5881_1 /TAXON_ID=311385 /ORGANISM="Pseudokeronopsis sp., Strain OXSARD2" /LENGTH=94 /DNA_ID=CAMNT_0010852551 /DNA_START=256 /DNA_END=540 /DNA_ORIENTATION=+
MTSTKEIELPIILKEDSKEEKDVKMDFVSLDFYRYEQYEETILKIVNDFCRHKKNPPEGSTQFHQLYPKPSCLKDKKRTIFLDLDGTILSIHEK